MARNDCKDEDTRDHDKNGDAREIEDREEVAMDEETEHREEVAMDEETPTTDTPLQPVAVSEEHDEGQFFDITEDASLEAIAFGVLPVFPEEEDVTVQTEGLQLSLSMEDLAALGADHVRADDDADEATPGQVTLALGLEESTDIEADVAALLAQFDEPVFDAGDEVVLLISEAQANAFAEASAEEQALVTASLEALGVDAVEAAGAEELAALQTPDDGLLT